jgi:Tol biopolymer transport system component
MSRILKLCLIIGITVLLVVTLYIWALKNIIHQTVLDDQYPEGLYNKVTISPNEDKVAFSYFKNREGAIYLVDSKGDIKRLTKPKKNYHFINPIFFDDGKQIMYLSSSYQKELKQAIYIMNVDGTSIKRLTPEEEIVTEAVVSQKDNKIYYIKAEEFYAKHSGEATIPRDYDLYTIEMDGSNKQKLTNFSSQHISDLSISSDGKKLGMVLSPNDKNENPINANIKNSSKEEEYVVYDIKTNKFIALPVPLSGYDATFPTLSPDGNKVAFNNDIYSEDEFFEYESSELSELSTRNMEIVILSNLMTESIVYADDNTLYFVYDKDNDDEKEDIRLAKIKSDGTGFTEVFSFDEIMK